jgi:putative hydroxymethylpyrimidine transport system permease protein
MRRVLPPAILLLAFLGIWELYVDTGGVNDLILASPHQIVSALYTQRGLLWSAFLVSAKEIVLGSLLAVVLGVAMATVMHFSGLARRAIYPLAIGSQAIPVAVLALPLIVWLGFGLAPKLLMIAVVSFFSIVVTMLAGLDAVDPGLPKLMRTFDAGRWRTFRHVELPSALPHVLTGLKLTLVFSVIADVLAEQAGANSGLGYILYTAESNLEVPLLFAAALIYALFAMLLFALLTLAERRLMPWAHQTQGVPRR